MMASIKPGAIHMAIQALIFRTFGFDIGFQASAMACDAVFEGA
jgi:hypothetical protein